MTGLVSRLSTAHDDHAVLDPLAWRPSGNESMLNEMRFGCPNRLLESPSNSANSGYRAAEMTF